ncbi:MAG: hypothetical protein QOC93_1862 [Actinomycetota bacterium]|jgi:SAM-dependent methyltransferase|nr:methyltransferase type 12 [Cryptosporangiaceae bacterium]MDQ1676718.1 hypothetical protein [Actinomycetota bacterium]
MTFADQHLGTELAADLAAVTGLLEIAEQLGISHVFDSGEPFTAATLAAVAAVPEEAVTGYLEALRAAAIVAATEPAGTFRVADDYADRRYAAGYLSWSLNANRPYLQHAAEFLRNPAEAGAKYQRNGRDVAVSSRWIGVEAFYPAAFAAITDAKPNRMVDLGAGAGGLLIQVLGALPQATGVALDLSAGACAEAARAGERAGVADRLTVVERSIQSIVDDPTPVRGADLIHAGFVFHDMLPDEEDTFDAVLKTCRDELAPGGRVAITDAVPYAPAERERRFSALFTYLHAAFMGRQLLTEDQWRAKFAAAGFSDVRVVTHKFPTGRLFLAEK